jgi:hypothetical protein
LQILESSSVTISGSFIRENAGNGILVSDQARLEIEDSYILSNGGDGLLLTGACQAEVTNMSITDNCGFGVRSLTDECVVEESENMVLFSGTISGAGNFISPSDTMMGNDLGRYCPESLLFLTEPKPEEK